MHLYGEVMRETTATWMWPNTKQELYSKAEDRMLAVIDGGPGYSSHLLNRHRFTMSS